MFIEARRNIDLILNNETPEFIAYSPNYWQWFAHQENHCLLDEGRSYENQT